MAAWDVFTAHYMLENLLEVSPCTLMKSEGGKFRYYVKLGSSVSASQCVAGAKADPNFMRDEETGICRRPDGNVSRDG
jgi:hypothetical protein